MSVVMHKSGQECWWWGNRSKLNRDQVSEVMHKGVDKVKGSGNERALVWDLKWSETLINTYKR